MAERGMDVKSLDRDSVRIVGQAATLRAMGDAPDGDYTSVKSDWLAALCANWLAMRDERTTINRREP